MLFLLKPSWSIISKGSLMTWSLVQNKSQKHQLSLLREDGQIVPQQHILCCLLSQASETRIVTVCNMFLSTGIQRSVADPGFWKGGFSSNSALAHRGAWLRSSGKKNSPSFFTFQNGLSSHIHALHCYLVHDIVLNFDDGGNLRATVKSIRKVMKSETRLILLASYTTYPV